MEPVMFVQVGRQCHPDTPASLNTPLSETVACSATVKRGAENTGLCALSVTNAFTALEHEGSTVER